jgi:hypothetical protein
MTYFNELGQARVGWRILSGGVTPTYLLDTYSGATAAYSLRKLRTAYTGAAIRVRRQSDDTTQDIGFKADGSLDTTVLLAFVGSSSGFISIWYDQSGNNNHANQPARANQPQIVSTGNLQLVNGKPSIYFNASAQNHLVLTTSFTAGSSNFHTFVSKRVNTNDKLISLAGTNSGANYILTLWSDNNYYYQPTSTSYISSVNKDLTSNQTLLTGMNVAGTLSISKNGSTLPSAQSALTYTPTINSIGKYSLTDYPLCYLQEILYYNSDNSSNKTGIESNINSFYTIY